MCWNGVTVIYKKRNYCNWKHLLKTIASIVIEEDMKPEFTQLFILLFLNYFDSFCASVTLLMKNNSSFSYYNCNYTNYYCSIIQKRAGKGLIQVSEYLGMKEKMSSDLWRVHKWNQNLIFQDLLKVEKESHSNHMRTCV